MLTQFLYGRECRGIRENFFRVEWALLRRRAPVPPGDKPSPPTLTRIHGPPELTRRHPCFSSKANDQLGSIRTTALIRNEGQCQIRIREESFRPFDAKRLQNSERRAFHRRFEFPLEKPATHSHSLRDIARVNGVCEMVAHEPDRPIDALVRGFRRAGRVPCHYPGRAEQFGF